MAKTVKNRSCLLRRSLLLRPPLFALVFFLTFFSALSNLWALTIIRDFIGGTPPANPVGQGNLIDIFNAAADQWEAAIQDPHTIVLHFGWGSATGGTHQLITQGGTPNRETEGTILFNNDDADGHLQWYLDPTPKFNEEYTTYSETAHDFGGGEINNGRLFSGATGEANTGSTRVDLLSAALHEIGHAMGMSIGDDTFADESQDSDIDIAPPRPLPGTSIPLAFNNFGVTSHIDAAFASDAIMAGLGSDQRNVLSALDILAMAQLSGFEQIHLNPYPTLRVTHLGTGAGTVTSHPAGIQCSADCVEPYNLGVEITLTATAAAGSTFDGWSGDDDCADGTITMDVGKTCTAVFNAVHPVAPTADLAVSQSDLSGPVITGSEVTYTVSVVNNGPSPASGVMLTDIFPAGATFQSATASEGSCPQSSGRVSCAFDRLSVGEVASVSIVVTPASGGTMINHAEIHAAEPDPNPADNTSEKSAEAIAPSAAAADLSITQALSPDSGTIGQPMIYVITVTNNGTHAASHVIVTEELPPTLAFSSAIASQGSCTTTTQIRCELGTIDNQGSSTIRIVVTPLENGTSNAKAEVAGEVSDPNTINNSTTTATVIHEAPSPGPQGVPEANRTDDRSEAAAVQGGGGGGCAIGFDREKMPPCRFFYLPLSFS
ncbi:MAG: DUF11 domain-containing protein [Nitrospirae bacterium]|nr:DUF11 domain-containing protein [Candidatus Manganitrophaceae bacterium]